MIAKRLLARRRTSAGHPDTAVRAFRGKATAGPPTGGQTSDGFADAGVRAIRSKATAERHLGRLADGTVCALRREVGR
ncbi:hypothetical protein Aph01nite_16220 [Acrocarpospora phusangensis]|uniref:Uncharacterized protein n=1 Tax=Acrocarpospora phusangensis TaxID=1070424 RepID=A0A919UMG4_9ACTN|nr:hypothetical protein Aph01nite_16220 [Acrocarpospora phusangensis]